MSQGQANHKEAVKKYLEKATLIIHSSDILGDGKLVIIQHGDIFYRLMMTRQGKLILTK